jgi:hypothetical protein
MIQADRSVGVTVEDRSGDPPADDRVYYMVGYRGRHRGWLSYSYEADRRSRPDGRFMGLDLSQCTDVDAISRVAADCFVIQVASRSAGRRNARVRRGEAPWFGLFLQVLQNGFTGYSISRVDGVPAELVARAAVRDRDLIPSL